jgi:glycosyltransferase involved in cell wall biosynthesis
VDLVIALKFPAYLTTFANKKLWLLHQFRQAYELWGGPFQDLPDTPEGRRVRDAVIAADNRFLREAREIYTNSRIVASRLKQFNGIQADAVLYPPLPNPEIYRSEAFGDFFFYPSRLSPAKRQDLAIEAMRHTRSDFKLVIAGKADDSQYEQQLRSLIARYDLQEKVQLLGWISEEEKASLFAKAFGVLYVPYDEDSYGYVSLEAFQSRKFVVTFTDSGGTDELIEHDRNGLIIEPSPLVLAEQMEHLWADKARARCLGENAYQTLADKGISWQRVLERLLA